MASLNKVMLIGNVGTDPEMRFTPNGNPVTSFRLAASRFYTTSSGERRQETDWFTIITWNKLAETSNQFLSKGQKVYVEGRLRLRNWEGRDGQKRVSVEVIANQVLFLDKQAVASLPEDEGAEVDSVAIAEPDDSLPD
ncbi:MAG: single-stranded DNA-binding protein [Dehalococcoidia bacterium]|nr:single-stranded DNA-binding protein [Dehalococcoidia bacterium]